MPMPETTTSTTGTRLKAARLKAGLTQSQLAAAMGTAPQTVSDVENDRTTHPASLEWLLRAAGVLRVKASSLNPWLAPKVPPLSSDKCLGK